MRDDSLRFQDIQNAIENIEKYSKCTRQEFMQNELVQVWVVHHLQMIGEAARGISSESRARLSSIPWPKIIGLRNILVHHYFSIDPEEIWRVLEVDIPKLKADLEKAPGPTSNKDR